MNQGTVYGIYLSDHVRFTCTVSLEKIPESGDILFGKRSPAHELECTVVLGFAATKLEAKRKANAYLRQVGQLHRVEDLDELELGETQLL